MLPVCLLSAVLDPCYQWQDRAVFTWLSKGIGFGFGFTTPFGWLVYLLWFWFYDSQVKTALIEDETIYNFWRFLVEDFYLPVIKPPGTYFNNKLLPSCRSSKFSSSFPATSVLLCAPLDPIHPARNSKSAWRQIVFIFLRQTLHWKLRRAATLLIK